MKVCKVCKESKSKSLFYGVQGECKECTKERVRRNSAKVGNAYDFSEIGVIRVIYKTQKRNNKRRGHGELPYTKEELSLWLYNNGFKRFFDKWVSGGHKKDDKPSVDRINSLKGYSFGNIRLVTWADNRRMQYEDILSGSGSSGKMCKQLNKLNEDGELVCSYVSYSSAARDMGYSLEYQIKNGVKCRSGFFWRYSSEPINNQPLIETIN